MKLLGKAVIAYVINALGLYAAERFIPGFAISGDTFILLKIAIILTVLTLLIKPLLKILLTPIIIITLGLGLIVVNALVLHILDFLSKDLTIESTMALIWASLLMGVIHFGAHMLTRSE